MRTKSFVRSIPPCSLSSYLEVPFFTSKQCVSFHLRFTAVYTIFYTHYRLHVIGARREDSGIDRTSYLFFSFCSPLSMMAIFLSTSTGI